VVSGVWVSGENWAQRVDNSDTCGTAHLWGVNNNNNTGVIWLAGVRQVCICSPVRCVIIIIIIIQLWYDLQVCWSQRQVCNCSPVRRVMIIIIQVQCDLQVRIEDNVLITETGVELLTCEACNDNNNTGVMWLAGENRGQRVDHRDRCGTAYLRSSHCRRDRGLHGWTQVTHCHYWPITCSLAD